MAVSSSGLGMWGCPPCPGSPKQRLLLTVLRGSVAEGEPQVAAVHVLDGDCNLNKGRAARKWSGQHPQPPPDDQWVTIPAAHPSSAAPFCLQTQQSAFGGTILVWEVAPRPLWAHSPCSQTAWFPESASFAMSKLGSGNVITPAKWAGLKHNQLPKHWWVQHYGKCVLALISCFPLGQLHGNGANHSWRNAGVSPQLTLSNGWNKIQYAIKVKAFLSWAIPCPAEHRHWISPILFPTESCINGTLTPREVILTV